MASRRPIKPETPYRIPELDPELIVGLETGDHARRRRIAKLALLWQERRFLLRCALLGFACSTLLAFLLPVRYTSTTRLMPPDQAGGGLAALAALAKGGSSGGSDLGIMGSELLGMRTTSDLFVGVLGSRTVQDDLINKFDLRKLYGDRHIEEARKDLHRRISIEGDRKSGIVTIEVSDRNPQRAAAMARECVEQLNQIVVTLNTSSAHKERVFLENRLQQVQQDLETAERDFSKFASENTALDVKEQGKAMLSAAAELEGQLIATQTQLEGLRQIYTDNNVRVRSLEARIAEYRRQLQKLTGNADTADSDTATNGSAAPNDDLYPSIRKLPALGVTWADLYRRTKVQEVVFETLTKQFEMARVEEAREVPSIKVLDIADVPEERSFPPRVIVICAGSVLIGIFGMVWVLANARWQEIDAQDPARSLAREVVESVHNTPWVSRTAQSRLLSRFQSMLRRPSADNNHGGDANANGK
jgi:capsule polysaccharide export protein KpsE/RkpR